MDINRDSPSVTPEMHAKFLEKYAHCLGVVYDPPKTEKFFVYNIDSHEMSYGMENIGFKVIYNDDKAVQVIKYSADAVKRMAECAGIKFGD